MALVSSAISRAFLPLPASLGRPTWPSPCPFLKAALAFLRSKLPSPFTSVSDFFCQTHIICAAFSSSVMRDNRSLTRRTGGSAGDDAKNQLRFHAIVSRRSRENTAAGRDEALPPSAYRHGQVLRIRQIERTS